MTLEAKTAETFSKTLTPFAVAAIISVVSSRFSPKGIGRVMSPFSLALIGILTLCVFPLVPVLYSASIGRTDLGVSDVTKRVPLYGVGLIGYAIAVVTFRVLDNKLMFAMALAYLCVSLAMCVITLVLEDKRAHCWSSGASYRAGLCVRCGGCSSLCVVSLHDLVQSQSACSHAQPSFGGDDRRSRDYRCRILCVVPVEHSYMQFLDA